MDGFWLGGRECVKILSTRETKTKTKSKCVCVCVAGSGPGRLGVCQQPVNNNIVQLDQLAKCLYVLVCE